VGRPFLMLFSLQEHYNKGSRGGKEEWNVVVSKEIAFPKCPDKQFLARPSMV